MLESTSEQAINVPKTVLNQEKFHLDTNSGSLQYKIKNLPA
jgi:hypothetical protein